MEDGVLTTFLEIFRRCGEVSFCVRAHPNAKKTQIRSVMDDGSVKIDIAAVPDDGKANEELLRFLAQSFEVHVSHVELVSGQTSRQKIVRIRRGP